jgi:hypothetical protein
MTYYGKIAQLVIAVGIMSLQYGRTQSPGNVSGNIQVWLKADVGVLNGGSAATDGQAANTWTDQSGARTNNATDVSLSPPTYRNNSADCINYNPVVDFDGADDGLDYGNDYIFSSGVGAQDGMTWFAIIEPDLALTQPVQFVYDFGQVTAYGYGFRYASDVYGMYTPGSIGGVNSGSIAHPFGLAPTLSRVTVDFGVDQTVNLNGEAVASYTSAVTLTSITATDINEAPTHLSTYGPFTVGRQCKVAQLTNNNGRFFDGSIAELIGYNTDLSTAASVKQIESYLAVKYAVTLDNTGGGTNGDYLNTVGTTIWDASVSATHHNDVIGIGRDDNEALRQKQSHTYDDITRMYINTLQASNSANTGVLAADQSYAIIGDNQGQMCATLASNLEIPGTCGLYSRLEREWKVTKSNFAQSFNLDWTLATCAVLGPVNVSDLRLLVDDDGDFSNGGTSCYFNGDGTGVVLSYANPVVTITGISNTHILNNTTAFITLASIQSVTSLPIVLINFSAKEQGFSVDLKWQTASEVNNDYFTLERTKDGYLWEAIGMINGAGNSSAITSYAEIDEKPYLGTSYYRLKQTDYDGSYSYSEIESVHFDGVGIQLIYPNPCHGIVHLQINSSISGTGILSVFDELGRLVKRNSIEVIRGLNAIGTDLSNLSKGVHHVNVSLGNNEYWDNQILIIGN